VAYDFLSHHVNFVKKFAWQLKAEASTAVFYNSNIACLK